MNFLVIALFSSLITFTTAYKVLGIFPYNGKSHFRVFEPLLKSLAEKGHEVTVIGYHPQEKKLANYQDISIRGKKTAGEDSVDLERYQYGKIVRYVVPFLLMYLGLETCHNELALPVIKEFLDSKPKFDVILIEMFNSQCFLGLVHKLQAPYIGVSTAYPLPWHDAMFGFTNNPAYVPNHFMLFSSKMTFLERVENTVLYIFYKMAFCLLSDIPNNSAAWKHLGDDIPPVSEIAKNASLVLINNHFTYTPTVSSEPGFIEVAGVHLGKPKMLPENIEKWISESTHGVIYFSLGSMIKGHTFPDEKRQMFLKAFARLPQRVLWKWETEMKGQPDNVMIQKWMPQFDILSHPNVKAFVAHGGLLGTTESVHCGVPMVILPQFGDQFANAKAVESSGGGVVLDFTSLTEEIIYDALKTVLNPEFNKKAKELSERFRDRPLPPLETAIYWVEYVARHKGAPHMRTAAVGMPTYQYLLLDVFAFLAFLSLIGTTLTYLLVKKIFNKLFKSNSVKPKKD